HLVGLFPANWDEEGHVVWSHQGLTYGGLILSEEATQQLVMQMFQAILQWYSDFLQAKRMVYKAIPYIYSSCGASEDLYALFRAGARLRSRGVSSAVAMNNPLRMRKLRLRGAKKAIESGLYIDRMSEGDWNTLEAFWEVLTEVLHTYHDVAPVHTVEEMKLLMTRFPQQIKLYLVRKEQEVVAGCVTFLTQRVAHIQYIAASEEGRETGALDLLFRHLINERFKQMAYVDFGISTEHEGQYLNEGLIFQKEGFGARTVCYDTYELEIDRALASQKNTDEKTADGQVKFLDLKRITASFEPTLSEEILSTVHSGWYLQGQRVAAFERHFAEYIGTNHCILCGNGLEALTLTLRALKFLNMWAEDSEVIVSANTFIATILAIREAGLCPVLAEPSAADFLIDTERLEELRTERTVAILPVHLYGQVCDMERINNYAAEHHLLVVEDAAQAHGAMWGDRRAGHLGHAGCFSFYPGKNLGALSDSGCVTTDDDTLAELVRKMANYGSKEKYVHVVPGINSRSDELQAAVLDVKLPRLDRDNERRRQVAHRYLEGIDNPLVTLPAMPKNEKEHVCYAFVVRSPYRDELREWLSQQGVETIIHYPIPPHRQGALPELMDLKLPVTEQLHREVLSLPISPLMTEAEVERVIKAVNLFNVSQ
nr:GNAT family N-acetyltransferase [Bacteroidaceae bacterium]